MAEAPAPAPSPAPAPAPAPAPEPSPAPAPAWHGFTTPEDIAFVDNKGWKSPADIVKSYRGAEGLLGRDPSHLVQIPRSDDPAGFRAVMEKLGLPASADKYEFDKPDGVTVDPAYETWAKDTFHKVGLPANVAKALTAEHNAFIKATLEKQNSDYAMRVQSDKDTLAREWGGGAERMYAAASTAAKALGFTAPMIAAMEKEIGYAGTHKFFAQVATKLGEDSFVKGGAGGGKFTDTMTPAEAKVAWDTMRANKDDAAALTDNQHPGHKLAKEKQAKLFAIMYPTGA